ncbi:hypothetical protein OBBRIDRAFT_764553 [Obba rivulosa]|uniref:Heterokaryon incompatibility domain-containing protein n=1 Tax=Obba rivulosa TaxID=1052685 RepID=A0A8E2AHE6_9APHY|nr:hypothetical protein OBBRIDRAFT_764553 [Obba rivulosa]
MVDFLLEFYEELSALELHSLTNSHISHDAETVRNTSIVDGQFRAVRVLGRQLADILRRRYCQPLDPPLEPNTTAIFKAAEVHDPETASEAHSLDVSLGSDSVPLIAKDAVWLGGKHDEYPLVPFLDYKQTRRNPASLQRLEQSPDFDYAALHQSHMTFGLLEAVVEQKIPESLLLQYTPNGDVVMTTRNINRILEDWIARIWVLKNNDDDQALAEWFERAWTTLKDANQLFQREFPRDEVSVGVFRKAGVLPDDAARIVQMIAAIGEALIPVVTNEFDSEAGMNDQIWLVTDDMVEVCRREMAADGWCPFMVAKLANRSVCTLGYASTFQPFIRDGVGKDGHARCTGRTCVLNNIDAAVYSNRHVMDTCKCAYSRPPLDAVIETLASNEIPIIMIPDYGAPIDDMVTMTCSTASSAPYVAISHVWADGLGSTSEVGLPTCQLRRLAMLASQLVPDGVFWMDGLCVPERKDMRKRAIGLMCQTYREAAAVLVIDSGIRSCSVKAPLQEKQLRVATSGWIQRLWTLQETAVAKAVVFEFSDGLLSIKELFASPWDVSANPVVCFLSMSLYRLGKWAENLAPAPEDTFYYLFDALEFRTTSKLEDETVAVSGLLGVDAFELASLPPEQRMMGLLLRIRELPSDIILLGGQKLNKPGFRWAPRTLMLPGGLPMGLRRARDAVCTAEGLLATYLVVRFDVTTFREDEAWLATNIPDLGNLVLRSDGPGADVASKYSCNALLFRTANPQFTRHAVAVLTEDTQHDDTSEGEMRLVCVYVRRLSFVTSDRIDGVVGRRIVSPTEARKVGICIT